MGVFFGGFLAVFLIGKVTQLALNKYLKIAPIKALEEKCGTLPTFSDSIKLSCYSQLNNKSQSVQNYRTSLKLRTRYPADAPQ